MIDVIFGAAIIGVFTLVVNIPVLRLKSENKAIQEETAALDAAVLHAAVKDFINEVNFS